MTPFQRALAAATRGARLVFSSAGDPTGRGRPLLIWLQTAASAAGMRGIAYVTQGIHATSGQSRAARAALSAIHAQEVQQKSFRIAEADRPAGAVRPTIGLYFKAGYTAATADVWQITGVQEAARYWEIEAELRTPAA